MYVTKLLIKITSLYFVEDYSTMSEIKFGYGPLYEHGGQLFHGLNRYYVLAGIDILKFISTKYYDQLENT